MSPLLFDVLWVAGSFVIAALFCGVLLPLLKRLQFRQNAYEDAPQTHQKKTGTPTMGGIVFVLVLVPVFALKDLTLVEEIFFLVAACAAIGFVDDYLSIRSGKNRGLSARTKFLATILVAITFLRWTDQSYELFPRDVLFHSGSYALIVPHWLWLGLGMLAIAGTIHAVNLTDGLDGLAAGTMIPPLLAFASIAASMGLAAPTAAALSGVGGCAGFLVYNRYPAKMFMGDTGSLALGALLSGVAILTGEMLLLILIGGVFVAETLSVILQVTYFKLSSGKRIFRMSPLHHHFELGGWPETKVTTRFWVASTVLSVVGWAVVR
ncbi:MAG TPA: phospho-N-acetylmuramoyl-pentapeptide-transferase [Candidatus Acidoferrales bacterium]|jgi:phospho-N-acetylmuramoyl-pentapeptide-transferase|nr:phospho-N-acetylmuramoyl-pentapeptide-transferase [Candidatus Acidoferrales bacterium]